MKNAFIIAEYNPFHNGHKYHIAKTRELTGADHVIAVMSGNFVQRGEAALAGKFERAQAAVKGGADLVIELPVKYAVANAAHFAAGAVKMIKAAGLPGIISFGASADTEELLRLNELLLSDVQEERIKELSCTAGKTFPAARDEILRKSGFEKEADMLKDPNNILAAEYIKNIGTGDWMPLAVIRTEEYRHDAAAPSGDYASASYIRAGISENGLADMILRYIPESTADMLKEEISAGGCPLDKKKYEAVCLSRLLLSDEKDFRNVDNVSQGLENKIVEAVKNSVSLEEVYAKIKSKRFTMSRIRQIIIQSVLGITREDTVSAPGYIRVLAFNEKGREALGQMRKSAAIPIVTNLSDTAVFPECKRDAELEYTEDKLFDICRPISRGGNLPYREHPVYVK